MESNLLRLRALTAKFSDKYANDLEILTGVLLGEEESEVYKLAQVARKVYSILLLSAARSGLILPVNEGEIPHLFREDDSVFQAGSQLEDMLIYDNRVIETVVKTVLCAYDWTLCFLNRKCEYEYEVEGCSIVRQWIQESIAGLLDVSAEEMEEQLDMESCSQYAVVAYENEQYSRIMRLSQKVRAAGIELDKVIDEQLIASYREVAEFCFSPVTLPIFDINKVWDGEKCFHCSSTFDTIVYSDYGPEYLNDFSYFKYLDPFLLFQLPKIKEAMDKIEPVLKDLVDKTDAGEYDLKTVA